MHPRYRLLSRNGATVKLSPAKVTGRLGLLRIERVTLAAGHKVIAIPEELDTGIDGFIEFSDSGTGARLIAFQSKCGPSYFDQSGPRHSSDSKHLRCWMQYPIPVLLIVLADDDQNTPLFWMDARSHIRSNPSMVESGPRVLRPPLTSTFDAQSLNGAIRDLAEPSDSSPTAQLLSDPSADVRLSVLSLLYPFRCERRAVFCVAALLHTETSPENLRTLLDFYSRYFSHPEAGFACDKSISRYAYSLISGFSTMDLLRLLAAFNDDDHCGDWSGATEIFRMSEEEIWHPLDSIARGTPQQGIAEIARAVTSPDQLLTIIRDVEVSVKQRNAAIVLFGYLGFRCEPAVLSRLIRKTPDDTMRALLTWLRHWMRMKAKH